MRGRRPATAVRGLAAALCCAAGFALAPAAGAGGLQLTPTQLTLSARSQADGLWLINGGDRPLQAQVRVFRWVQTDGEERFEPGRALAVSPPMLELAPGARQLVRVIRLGPPPAEEESYRLIVDELPPAEGERKPGLQFVLRYSVPVFLAPAGDPAIAPALSAQLRFETDRPSLELLNQGRRHAQVADLVFVDAQQRRHPIAAGLLGYALPGQRVRWPLNAPAELLRGPGTLKARINGEPTEQALALDPPAR
ncbi:fimbria/pilus periplasmic chaperone [Lysobacter firmicutimachus]|uniref:Fimbria/pilus periplasmic chaperone n=1 Tax=Lysobacter firmicutimachus TaxID=1792846 RepID=A0AAU8MUU8_9GAMM|nr:fimbria/pilus periplasmic chaperone [Lysobacter antibioticus]